MSFDHTIVMLKSNCILREMTSSPSLCKELALEEWKIPKQDKATDMTKQVFKKDSWERTEEDKPEVWARGRKGLD